MNPDKRVVPQAAPGADARGTTGRTAGTPVQIRIHEQARPVQIRIHEQARPVQYRQPGLLGTTYLKTHGTPSFGERLLSAP
jgi:cytosine/adenosine deaminase-related metal-dependent hydrolase